MPIRVTCPGCFAKFQVSDKFGGKQGPCPKCKTVLTIPEKSEEVVIHAPDDGSPKDSKGKSVLNPIKRTETKFSLPLAIGAGAAVLVIPIVAWVLGGTFDKDAEGRVVPNAMVMSTLAVGAILLSYPIVVAGYSFLRNDELEPYSGFDLILRGAICSAVYAAVWGLHWYLGWMNLYSRPMEIYEVAIALPVLFVPGALASMATLDLDGTSAAFHYGFYLLAGVSLRLIMGLPPL